MDGHPIAQAIAAWEKILGSMYVVADEASLAAWANIVGGLTRRILAVIRPESTDEVRDVVEIANRYRIPLHPVSCRRNWGLDSGLSVTEDCVLVELGRMDRIHEVNVEGGYAVIEPGVTQRQLYSHLKHRDIPLVINVTASSPDASIIGSALDRGTGYSGSRAEELSGLEVVLGSGDLLTTGFGHYGKCETVHLYRHGIGPSLDGLLHQGNFGIVTRAGIRLMPRTPCRAALLARIRREDQLPDLVDALAGLTRSGAISHVAHIGNYLRSEGAIIDAEGFGPWSAVCGLTGTTRQVAAARRDIHRALRGVASVMYLTDGRVRLLQKLSDRLDFIPAVRRKKAILPAVVEHYGLTCGVPTSEPLRRVRRSAGESGALEGGNPDDLGSCGLLHVLPILPLRGAAVREAADMTVEEFGRKDFDSHIAFNLLEGRAVEAVINLYFDQRDEERTRAAHEVAARLEQRFIDRGWYPYRVGVQSMGRVVHSDDPYWRALDGIKKVLDPNGIMAPGRYGLT